MLDLFNVNNTFKLNWVKSCVSFPESIWYFIPHNIFFIKVGGFKFLLTCNVSPSKLPIKLSKFHEQALLAWKLSPHKVKLWNNETILAKNKSIFFNNWHEKGIDHLCDLLDPQGNFYSYNDFMSKHNFPVIHKEFLTKWSCSSNEMSFIIWRDCKEWTDISDWRQEYLRPKM